MGFKANFTEKDIDNLIDTFYNRALVSILEALKEAAQQVVNIAKNLDTYTDQTGILRSSIGYVIFFDGQKVASSFGQSRGPGVEIGENYADTVAEKYNSGYVVVIVAGADYAAYVEAKNFDVITGPTMNFEENFRNSMKILQDNSGIEFSYVKL